MVFVTINRPQKKNAFDAATIAALHEAFETLHGADHVRVVFLHHGEPLATAPVAHFQAALGSAFARLGWGLLTLDFRRYDQGLIVAELRNAPPAPGVALLVGALAGLFEHFAGRALDCALTQDTAGAEPLRFVIGLPERLERVADAVQQRRTHDEVLAELAEVRL